jgi:hypothetical protein
MNPAPHPHTIYDPFQYYPSDLFPSGLPTNILYEFLISAMCDTCPTIHLFFLDLNTLIFGEEYKL